MLALVYTRVFHVITNEPVKHDMQVRSVRLLPVSGDKFVGKFLDQIGDISFRAMAIAFGDLPADKQTAIMDIKTIHVCVFARKQAKGFRYAKAGLLEALRHKLDLEEKSESRFCV